MNAKSHIAYLVIIVLLSVVLGISFSMPAKVVETVKSHTDTITLIRYDTVTLTKVVERERRVVDTVYIHTSNGDVPVPMSNYRFFEDNKYDILAYGYNVRLDQVKVFPITEYRTITNTIEKEIVIERWDVYFGAGFNRIGSEWAPTLALTFKSPKRWLFSANASIYNNKPVWGITAQYKITNNK